MADVTQELQDCVEAVLAIEHGAWFHFLSRHFYAICQAAKKHCSEHILRGQHYPTRSLLQELKRCPPSPSPSFCYAATTYGLDGLIIRKALRFAGDAFWRAQIEEKRQRVFSLLSNYVDYFVGVWGIKSGWPKEEFVAYVNLYLVRALDRYSPASGLFVPFVNSVIRTARLHSIHSLHAYVSIPLKQYHKQGKENGQALRPPVSLYSPSKLSKEEGKEKYPLHELYLTEHPQFEEQIDTKTALKAMQTALSQLNERQRFVITSLFGLNGSSPKTLREVGQQLGISHERVRQIKEEALRKLNNMIRSVIKTSLCERG